MANKLYWVEGTYPDGERRRWQTTKRREADKAKERWIAEGGTASIYNDNNIKLA
jgi:hypothetical protein